MCGRIPNMYERMAEVLDLGYSANHTNLFAFDNTFQSVDLDLSFAYKVALGISITMVGITHFCQNVDLGPSHFQVFK